MYNIKMKEKIEPQEDIDYIFVETIKEEYNSIYIDISLFEENEWKELLLISNKFEENVQNSFSDNDNEYNAYTSEQKIAIYFLYYCDFCKYEGFNTLHYEKGKYYFFNKLLNNALKNRKDNELITVHQFRKWIVEHYDKMKYYHSILPK
jgi:hypothetical protein